MDADEFTSHRGGTRPRRLVSASGLPLATVTDPFGLGVHRLPRDRGQLPPLTPYYRRRHDDYLAAVIRDARSDNRSGLAFLVGKSGTGKTRALWEALALLRAPGHPDPGSPGGRDDQAASRDQDWYVWCPGRAEEPVSLFEELAGIGPRTVIWLDDAWRFLFPYLPGAREMAQALSGLLANGPGPVVVLATARPDFWAEITSPPPTDKDDPRFPAWELLHGRQIMVPARFAPGDREKLRGSADPRLARAARAPNGEITQLLAAVPVRPARRADAPPGDAGSSEADVPSAPAATERSRMPPRPRESRPGLSLPSAAGKTGRGKKIAADNAGTGEAAARKTQSGDSGRAAAPEARKDTPDDGFTARLKELGAFKRERLGGLPSNGRLGMRAAVDRATVRLWLTGDNRPVDIEAFLTVLRAIAAEAARQGVTLPAGLFDEARWWDDYVRAGVPVGRNSRTTRPPRLYSHTEAHPAGRPLIEMTDPVRLGVRWSPPAGTEGQPPLPPYYPRHHDDDLAELATAAKSGTSGLAVLVGEPGTGKTRALWEALAPLRDSGQSWRVWAPGDPPGPAALLDRIPDVTTRTVIWLDDAWQYLAPGLPKAPEAARALDELLKSETAPVLILASLLTGQWTDITSPPGVTRADDDPRLPVRTLLTGHRSTVPPVFSALDRHRLHGSADPRLRQAALAAGGKVAQHLAGIPEPGQHDNARPRVRGFQPILRDCSKRLGKSTWLAGKSIWSADLEERQLIVDEIEVTEIVMPGRIRDRLGLGPEKTAILRSRRYVVNGKPVLISRSWLPASIAAGTRITQPDTGPGGIYARLADLGHAPSRFHEELSTRLPRAVETRRLELAVNTPVVNITRVAFGADGAPVEVNEMTADSSAFRFRYDHDK